jgi:hypothetical protein
MNEQEKAHLAGHLSQHVTRRGVPQAVKALKNGAGLAGAIGAGATAAVGGPTVVAAAAVPAPFVVGAAVVGGIAFGVYKLFAKD